MSLGPAQISVNIKFDFPYVTAPVVPMPGHLHVTELYKYKLFYNADDFDTEMEKYCTHINEIKHEGTQKCIRAHKYLFPFLIGNVRAVEPQFNFSFYLVCRTVRSVSMPTRDSIA